MALLRKLTLGTGLVALLSGCSHLRQLAAGPAASIVDRRASWGGAVVGESVIGTTSPGGGFTGVGAGARGAFTERVIDVAPFLGAHLGWSIDRTFFDGSLRLGPGLQLLEGRPLGFGSAGGSIGVGYAVSDTGWRPSWFYSATIEVCHTPVRGPDVRALQRADEAHCPTGRKRDRVLLTFALAADVDVRLTRSPMLALSALVGVAWMDEVTSSE